ncbi:hypothetical protein NDK50_31110 [Paraburkholderia bryophila]|uniref:hypothetical protein n=1 Tax=Paraburkholderia bryophila TaxID=420952 RepID=UPI00234AFC4F|nr:hypothetical protein [Paraburkholderia bryophila]WCM22462.1 hypothetical protein NDK50_31110 [Paraburkholderia bryophila]
MNDKQELVRLTLADFAYDVNRSWLSRYAPWTLTTGHWLTSPSHENWMWVDDEGQEICRYTSAQLAVGWDDIVSQSDMTWSTMERIDCMQLDLMIIQGVVSVICLAEETMFGVLLKDGNTPLQRRNEAPAAIFIALVVMIGTADEEALKALAASLGVDESNAG